WFVSCIKARNEHTTILKGFVPLSKGGMGDRVPHKLLKINFCGMVADIRKTGSDLPNLFF
ncbi:MAG: hypothetical protein NC034_06265, partial [Ruminococcus sp.]|nr:hypothetical protein [Ruminococcus sp.]